jgi:hypothetical protein
MLNVEKSTLRDIVHGAALGKHAALQGSSLHFLEENGSELFWFAAPPAAGVQLLCLQVLTMGMWERRLWR